MSTSSPTDREDVAASSGSGSGSAAPPLAFDCNICLDAVASPVVTLCGHLYWYRTLLTRHGLR